VEQLPNHPRHTHAVVVGAGIMGADVTIVLARGGCKVTVADPDPVKRAQVIDHVKTALTLLDLERRASGVTAVSSLADIDWHDAALVVECIPELLAPKQTLFAQLVQLAPTHTVLTSNSSSFPISVIGQGLATQNRMLGLHFFMPAHLVPLVEVVMGAQTDLALAERLCSYMRGCGSVPVLVRKDKPGFLAKRDHAGLDVHCAAAATMYPSLSNTDKPAAVLQNHVSAGHLGMKTGAGFFEWPEERRLAERQRYDRMLQQGLTLLADELPPLDRHF